MPKNKNNQAPERSWFTLKNEATDQSAKIWVHGDIGWYDIEAIDMIRALQSVGDKEVEIRVQSLGGSVYDGLAIFNALKAHKAKVVGIVDGVAASIATYLLMACDEILMPENATMMIHNPNIGAYGGEDDIESALVQLKNAKKTILDAYMERTGKAESDVSNAMDKETWFTAQEAVDFGLADKVIDAVDLSNSLKRIDAKSLQNFKHVPEQLLNHVQAQTEGDLSNTHAGTIDTASPKDDSQTSDAAAAVTNSTTTQVNDMPKPTEDLQNAVKKENQRQAAIRALCAQHKVSDELRDSMLNDTECDEAQGAQKILAALGNASATGEEASQLNANITPNNIHVGNGNITKDALQNALNARCGVAEVESDNPYRLKTLMDMAEISLGKEASSAASKSDLVARAFNTSDFAEILTEGVRTVMRDEAKLRTPLFRELASTENLPDFKETDLVSVNDAPDLMAIGEDGEYKSAIVTGTGEKIQLGTFGREVSITRQAIINDQISLISKLPRKFMQAGYRLADKLMFNAILAGKMGDGKDIFLAGASGAWGNLTTNITAGDYKALIMALHKSFATATSSNGDALDLRGQVLLANPDHASFLEAAINTASKPDEFNPAYKKFERVVETARLADLKGALALTSKDFDAVVMGFLDGQTDPWLETGDGFTSDGAKFRITYDVTSKVLDRRGLAKATFK